MRLAVVIAIICIAGAAIAMAFQPRAGEPAAAAPAVNASPRARTTLRWMGHWRGEDRREVLVREMAREFAFLHPDIDVDLRFPDEIMGQRSQRLTAEFIAAQIARAQPEWDVVWLDDTIYQHVADILGDAQWGRKHLVDFTAMPGFAAAHKPFITRDPVYAAQTGGMLVGPYIEGEYTVLWLNRELAARLGVAVPAGQPLWRDLIAIATRLQAERRAGRTGAYLLSESRDWLTSQFLFQALVASRFADVGRALSTEPDPAKRAAVREAVRAFAELGACEPLWPGHREAPWIDTRRLPLDDQVLGFVAGTWMYSHWRGIDTVRMARMAPVQLPVLAPVDHALGGYIPTWAVLARAPAREAAIALLMHWCNPDVAERWTAYTRNPTGLRGDLAKLTLSDNPFDRFMVEMERSAGSRIGRASNPGYALGAAGAAHADEFHDVLRALLAGEVDADDGWRRICAIAGWDAEAP